ncbi:MAG: HDOD domain-containing protein [Hydrogenothermaceae bacterium]|nr:HDOD domain-containing protein [Hydrogenothermaceae bacterium]
MGLFGFGGKKEEPKKTEEKKSAIEIDDRWNRYYLKDIQASDVGSIVYITKNVAYIKTFKENKELKPGMFLHLELNGKKYKTQIVDSSETDITAGFLEEFNDIEFIKKHTNLIQEKKPIKKISITAKDIENEKISSDLITLFNLLTEIEDPNTDAIHLKLLFDLLPPLRNKVIEIANSVSEGATEEIKDIETAILRLGFDKLKKVVSEYFDLFIANYKPQIENFENMSQLNLTKVEAYKRVAPYLSFQIKRKAGIILFLLDVVSSAATIFAKKDENYKNILKNSVYFYSYPLRQYERNIFGEDFLHTNYEFIKSKIKPLVEVYDSYKLGHVFMYPFLTVEKEALNFSNRNLKRAYIYYLSFLMVNNLVYNDKKSGYILYNRLRRFGMSVNEAVDFLNEIVFTVNKALSNIGIKPFLRSPSPPSYTLDVTKVFPETSDFKNLIDNYKKIAQGKENRLVIRTQDINFSSLLFWYLTNDNSIGLSAKTFAVIPARSIQNPDSLLVENLSSFDILYFKGIDELDPTLYREFYKLWKNFEGVIITDFSYYSFMDYDSQKIQLFHILKDKKIDAPLLTENRKAYEFMVKYILDEYTWLTGKTDYKNLENVYKIIYSMDSVWTEIFE